MASSKSKILFIGGTGYIGKYIVEASVLAGHPTLVLVREATLYGDSRAQVIDTFKSLGVDFIIGDLYDHKSLVEAIKKVDVVISTVGQGQLPDQDKIIAAIKEAGNVKRFFPSEFGNDVDRVHAVEPVKTAFAIKANVRRAVEAEGIPYTYVSSNFFSGYFLPTLAQPGASAPPRDKVIILGDGNPKVMASSMSKILFIGGTGYIGKYIVEASILAGHPTFVLIRESTLLNDSRAQVIGTFRSLGRFFPSEFGNDVDRVHAVETVKTAFTIKANIRRAVEAKGIPYTYVSSNLFSGYFLPTLVQPEAAVAPRDTVAILGDGNTKGKLRIFIET
ncbi:hypothetical protein Ddye_003914 [Dipteronia dyeriana]|uniref:NmrA-like domain-containing protein n=1 Tax=Dipteronia dyeriana TaxID=168575 RepID=A0AAD9XTL3_9ROSI|nr:hypothetical protein Ddye_003914 [Dipteronia dyeriana]